MRSTRLKIIAVRAALSGAVLCFVAHGAGVAADCAMPAPPQLDYIVPNDGGHDPVKVDRAIAYYTNIARCENGFGPLAADVRVLEAARLHSDNMAALNEFGHDISAPGAEGMRDRLVLAQVDYRQAAENIITGYFMDYVAGTRFFTTDAASCAFTDESGVRLKRHTYLTLAEEVVKGWMGSLGHRRNILGPDFSRHGAALAPSAETALCGGLLITQVFAG